MSDNNSNIKVEMSMEEHPVLQIHEYHKGDDEAFKILQVAGDHASPVTPEEEKVVRRKTDFILLPVLWAVLAVQYFDKAALGSAALFGIVQDLKLYTVVHVHPTVTSSLRYSNVAMIYQVGFLVGVFPLASLAQRLPTGKICAAYILIWGTVALLTTQCKDYKSIMVQRAFLGFLESGISPITLRLIGMWYKTEEHGMRASLMNTGTNFSVPFIIGVFIGITKLGNKAEVWKNLYWFCGSLTIFLSFVVLFIVPDTPATAWWLTERQRYVAVERIRTNQAGLTNKTFKWTQARSAFTDPKVLLLMLITFCVTAPSGATSNFSSLVIKNGYGADNDRTLILLMPIGLVAGATTVISGLVINNVRHSRVAIASFFALVTVVGEALQWRAPRSHRGALLAGVYIVACSSASYAVVTSLAVSNTAGASKKTTVLSLLWVSFALSAIASPYFFKALEAPRYPTAFATSMGLLAASAVLMWLYLFLCVRDNRSRDKLPPSTVDHAFDDLTDVENKAFRYSY